MDKQDAEDRANDDRYDERLMVHAELAAEILHKDAEIARLKAALEVERAACDRWRAHWNRCGYSATMAHDARVLDAIIAHDESRAASRAAQDGAR